VGVSSQSQGRLKVAPLWSRADWKKHMPPESLPCTSALSAGGHQREESAERKSLIELQNVMNLLANLSLNSIVGQQNFSSQIPRFEVKRKRTSSLLKDYWHVARPNAPFGQANNDGPAVSVRFP
jgi:hypothetical protein